MFVEVSEVNCRTGVVSFPRTGERKADGPRSCFGTNDIAGYLLGCSFISPRTSSHVGEDAERALRRLRFPPLVPLVPRRLLPNFMDGIHERCG